MRVKDHVFDGPQRKQEGKPKDSTSELPGGPTSEGGGLKDNEAGYARNFTNLASKMKQNCRRLYMFICPGLCCKLEASTIYKGEPSSQKDEVRNSRELG